jgi:hypothetical protein
MTGGVMKAVLYLLSAMAVLYVCALCTPQGSATLYRLPIWDPQVASGLVHVI